jgi:hypothetical protein
MKAFKILLFLAFLCYGGAINAQNTKSAQPAQNQFDKDKQYFLLGEVNDYKVYINLKSIQKVPYGYRMWTIRYLVNNQAKVRKSMIQDHNDAKFQNYQYTMEYRLFDINNSKYKLISFVNYAKNGEALNQYNDDYGVQPWEYVVPGTIMECYIEAIKEFVKDTNLQ